MTSALRDTVRDPEMTRDVFRENEIRANQLIAGTMLASALVMSVLWLLNSVGVLDISSNYVLPVFMAGITAFVIPAAICRFFHGEKRWIKFMLLLSATATLAYLDSILIFNAPLLIVLPVIFSCRYYSGSVTVRTALLTTVLFTASALLGAIYSFDNPDMNFANPDITVYVRDVMLLSFLPKWSTFAIISAFCWVIALYGRKMVLSQDEISKKAARVETELEMAGKIQIQALPAADVLPGNRCREFDLAAEMIPAKEVGGDFYDFFYPDSTHLALIIADVADKGIAASLFMMMAKTLLDSRISTTLSPAEVMETVNRQLYENSPQGMFVTVWLGILNLKNGELTAANAGHEYPVLRRKDGSFELVKDKHGFVLGGMKKSKYREYTIPLAEGDTLFVYTDGVPEANNPDGIMFGTERMLESLNRHQNGGMRELIDGLRSDLHGFVRDAAQFDDTTMMAFRMGKTLENSGIQVNPVIGELDTVQEYIDDTVGKDRVPVKQSNMIKIAVDEVFSNIVKYSGANCIGILCEADSEKIRIVFRDDGKPFDPLAQKDPEITPQATKQRIGGLGIRITRKIMDSVEYRYEDGMNILAITSTVKEKTI